MSPRKAAAGRDGRGRRRGHRDVARADRGLRPGRVLPRHRPAGSTQQFSLTIAFSVAHLGVQRADADARALRAPPRSGHHAPAEVLRPAVERVIEGVALALRTLASPRRSGSVSSPPASSSSPLVATYGVSRKVPAGFVPEEDQGYFIVAVQTPRRRLGRPRRATSRETVEKFLRTSRRC